MKNKVKLAAIKSFWSDPLQIQNKGQDPQFTDLFPLFLKARQAVSEILKQEDELIKKFKQVESDVVKKWAKGISITLYPAPPPSPQNPNPQPQQVFQHHFEPIQNYDDFKTEIDQKSKLHQKEYSDFCELEHEIEVEYCPYDKFPRLDLFPLEKQKSYEGFCIEPEKAESLKLVKA